jgi:hypothetical protein
MSSSLQSAVCCCVNVAASYGVYLVVRPSIAASFSQISSSHRLPSPRKPSFQSKLPNLTNMTVSKRESRLRRLLKKLRSCLPKSHPHHKYRSSYLDIEKQAPPPLPQHAQRYGLIGRREQPSKKTTTTTPKAAVRDASPKRAMPSPGRLRVVAAPEPPKDETIRFVNASATSLAGNRQGAFTPRFTGRLSYQTRQQTRRDQALQRLEQTHMPSSDRADQLSDGAKPIARPHGVLPFNESFQTQRAINQQLPRTPAEVRHDSAADLTVRPLNIRPRTHHAAQSDSTLIDSMASMTLEQHSTAREAHYGLQRSSLPIAPNGSKFTEALDDWEHDWDKPLQNPMGGSKGIWKTASHRLLIRNKDSIQKLEAEKAVRDRMEKRMEMMSSEQQQTQMRSIQSIEEMAEEDRKAREEWNGESYLSDGVSEIWVY